jgi:hypothetical protein
MSSEKRVIRPYVGVEGFQAVLDKWTLQIGQDLLLPGDQRVVTSSSYLHDPPVLVLAADDEELTLHREELKAALEAASLSDHEVELVVLSSTPYLRLADIAFRGRLSDANTITARLDLSKTEPPLRTLKTPSGGCNVDAYFVLAEDLSPGPLRPSKRGTWLGHVRFALRTELGDIGFIPRPLTDDVRDQHGLHADTIRYVVVESDTLEGDDMSAVELFVDVDVLTHLNQAPNTAAARFLQRQLFIDVMSSIARTVNEDDELQKRQLAEIEDDSVLDRVIRSAAGPGEKGEAKTAALARRQEAWDLLRNDPERFIAKVEANAAPRKDLITAIGGGDD